MALASDSKTQRDMENIMLNRVMRKEGYPVPFTNCRRKLNNASVEIDGFHDSGNPDEPLVLCEVWAHIGKPKSAQKAKIMKDAMKLLLFENMTNRNCIKYLIFADLEAAAPFQSARSWQALALKNMNFNIQIADLSKQERNQILAAQARQGGVMSKKQHL